MQHAATNSHLQQHLPAALVSDAVGSYLGVLDLPALRATCRGTRERADAFCADSGHLNISITLEDVVEWGRAAGGEGTQQQAVEGASTSCAAGAEQRQAQAAGASSSSCCAAGAVRQLPPGYACSTVLRRVRVAAPTLTSVQLEIRYPPCAPSAVQHTVPFFGQLGAAWGDKMQRLKLDLGLMTDIELLPAAFKVREHGL